MNFVGPLWSLHLADLLPGRCLPERWPPPFPKADRCRCGHPRYIHRPLLRSDGSREDGGDTKHAIDPCTWIGCGCGYFEPADTP